MQVGTKPIRLMFAVLLFVWIPAVCGASVSSRPVQTARAWETVNAIIGDESFVDRYGRLPDAKTPEQLRLTVHLEHVLAVLSIRDVSNLPKTTLDARRRNLARLAKYIDRGEFPANFRYPGKRRSTFVDQRGRICAVGYLIRHSAGEQLVNQINERFQYATIHEMRNANLTNWVAESGLTLEECAMIQPAYFFVEFDGVMSQTSGAAPLLIRLTGVVRTQGWNGDAMDRYTVSLPDGSEFVSGFVGADSAIVDTTFEMTCPGIGIARISAFSLHGHEWGPGPLLGLVQASHPSFVIAPRPTGETTSQIESAGIPSIHQIERAVIDWGDGQPIEEFSWAIDGNVYITPTHTYSTTGTFMVTITHYFEGAQCSFDQSSSTDVTIGATPVEEVTWGRIRVLFEG